MVPIFIGGCDRSGTTLLGTILGTHSQCLCIPEFQTKIMLLQCFRDWGEDNLNMKEVVDTIKEHWRFKIWGLDLKLNPDFHKEIGTSYIRLIEWIIRTYGSKVGKPSPSMWVDHTGSNIQYATTLFKLFPDGKMIDIVRDGRAVASSVIPLDWGPNTIVNAAPWWLENISYGLAVESLLPDKQIARIRYEDLVREPDITLNKLCIFLGIDYQAAMIKGNGFKVPKYTSGQHSLVGKRPDAKRLDAWENELSRREIEIFESLTGEMLNYFGYDLKFGLRARPVTRLDMFHADIKEIYTRYFINRLRFRRRFRKSLSSKNTR